MVQTRSMAKNDEHYHNSVAKMFLRTAVYGSILTLIGHPEIGFLIAYSQHLSEIKK